MEKKNFKSTTALVVMAIAMLFSSCSKDEAGLFGGLETNNNGDPEGTTYELLSSEHVSMAELSVNENVITIPCDHIAHFKSNVGDDTYDKGYDVTNSATIGNTSIATKDIQKIINQTYVWENGVFAIGESFLSMVFGETLVSQIRLGNQTFGKDELSYCTVVKSELILGDAEELEPKKFQVPATIIFTMSCGEDEQVSWEFTLTVIETSEDDEITERIENEEVSKEGIYFDYVVEHSVNTELNSRTRLLYEIPFALQAEAKRVFDTEEVLSLLSTEPSVDGEKFVFKYNLTDNTLTGYCPAEVTLLKGNAQKTIKLTPVVRMIGMSNTPSEEDGYNYTNYTIEYNMMVNGVEVAETTQYYSTRVQTIVDKINKWFENKRPGTQNGQFGILYDFVTEHSINTELNTRKPGFKAVNISAKAQEPKVFTTTEELSLLSNTPSVNGKEYTFAWNLFNNVVTLEYPQEVILEEEGVTDTYQINPSVRMDGVNKSSGNNEKYTFTDYKISYIVSVEGVDAATAQQLARTQMETAVNPTIPGYHLLKANQCDYYTDSRDRWVASPIYAIFVKDNDDSQMLFVEFDENTGVEKSRQALNGVSIPNFPLGRVYRSGEGTAPAYVQTNDTEYMWTSFTNKDFYSTVSVVSSVSQSLRNPVAYGKNNADGSISFNLSNGKPLKLK